MHMNHQSTKMSGVQGVRIDKDYYLKLIYCPIEVKTRKENVLLRNTQSAKQLEL